MLLFEVGFTEIEGILIVVLFGITFYVMMELKTLRREVNLKRPAAPDNTHLCLQAYERLTIYANRISLKNLISRLHSNNLTATELQAGCVEAIRTEYEHNLTQQNYVNPEVWKAVTNLKDQNTFIINQLAATLPPGAGAMDLSRIILQYADTENAELSAIVLQAISFEAKKLI